MKNYYLNLNAQASGDHEVHKETCVYYHNFKNGFNFEFLGSFDNELYAVRQAQMRHPEFKIDGCAYCCPNANKH